MRRPGRRRARPSRRPRSDTRFVGSIDKCFRVLEALAAARRPVALTELARRAGLDRSAVQRVTHTLHALGYLRQSPQTRAYALAARLVELGHAALAADSLRGLALPHLEALNERCGETVNLTELEGDEIVYVARFPSRHAVSVDLHVGSRLPAFCTAAGRAMLACLPAAEAEARLAAAPRAPMTDRTVRDLASLMRLLAQARERGYAINDQEAFVGDLSVATAIVDATGRPLGAINIAVPTPRWTVEALERELVPALVRCARRVAVESGQSALRPGA
jgi:DNA-binding IclR family transcriptional regulator